MLKIVEKLESGEPHQASLILPFEQRQKARLKTSLADGREVGLFLPRGMILRGGDLLKAEDGTVVKIAAAAESVSTVNCASAEQLARASYHLGNRHVAVEIGEGWIRYLHDHVLDEMIRGLGFEIAHELAAFEPEAGAYAAHQHSHQH